MELKAIITLLIILLTNVCHQCQSKNILCLLGVITDAAEKWNKVLLKELATRGHDLTIITPIIWDDDDLTNVNFIYLEKTKKFLQKRYENDNAKDLLEQSIWKSIINWYDQQIATCRGNLESIGLSEALHSGLKEKLSYDVIIYDLTYGPGCLLHLAKLFENIPIVGVSSGLLTADVLENNQRGILSPALDPYILSDFGKNMNYWRRLYNTALYGFDYCYRQWVVKPVIEGLWAHNMHTENILILKSLDGLLHRFKVILANYHPVLHTLTALPVNVVPVPGLHIGDNPSPSDSISLFIEHSKLGVVYIDLNIKIIGENNVKNILHVVHNFSGYGFIWNIGKNNKLQLKKPSNMLVGNDVENSDVLDQDKIKAILTIPETLRVQESLYFGVPIITVTLRPEQRYIAKRIEEQGFGISLELNNFNTEILGQSLTICLENTNLHKSVKQLQQSFQNQQNRSLDTAVWWVEHLTQNPEANDHLVAMSRETLGFFARNSFDVMFLFEFLIFICIANTIIVIRQTTQNFKKISKAKTKETKSKEDKSLKVKKTKKPKTKTS